MNNNVLGNTILNALVPGRMSAIALIKDDKARRAAIKKFQEDQKVFMTMQADMARKYGV